MPNATVRANTRTLPETTLSTDDLEVLQLWRERAEMKVIAACVEAEFDAAYHKRPPGDHALGVRCDAANNAVGNIESKVDGYVGKSVQALGAFLAMEIDDGREDAEEIPGLYRAMLAAIRPQLVGVIAEDADRALADDEADPTFRLVANLSAAWDRLDKSLKHTTHFEPHPLVDKAHRDIDAALAELLATPPTTLAGARAAIARLVEYDEHNKPVASGLYLRTLIRSPIFASRDSADRVLAREGEDA